MKRGVLFFLLIISLSTFVFAFSQSQVGTPSNLINEKYSLDSHLSGWINISLNGESADSLFQTSLGSQISLIDLIKQNELKGTLAYSCLPLDCKSDYSASGSGDDSKTISLGPGESRVIGLKFGGGAGDTDFMNARDFSISIISDAPETTSKQLFINILDDSNMEWQSYKSSGNFYNEDSGCYNSPTGTIGLTTTIYCEKITLPEAPKVEIGAYIINSLNPSASFTMSIEDENGKSATCPISALQGGRVACVPNFKIDTSGDYFVCIKATSSIDEFKYTINTQSNNNNTCGYATDTTHPRDFEVFAKPGKFSSINGGSPFILNDIEASSSMGSSVSIESDIQNYISDRYNRDCTKNCIVPIRIISGKNQQQGITISDINMRYTLGGVTTNGISKIYDITKVPAKITSGFIKLSLDDANFTLPKTFGESNLSLTFGGAQIFSQSITIEKIPQIVSINPTTIIAGFPTHFTSQIEMFNDNLTKITNYEWRFGNDSVKTLSNDAIYTFNKIGTSTITVVITDSNQHTSSKTFNVEISTAKQAVSSLLKKDFDNLNNIKSMIENFSPFEQDSLKSVLNFNMLDTAISSIQQKNATAISDQDYINIMPQLVNLSVPGSIDVTKSVDSLLFFPSKKNINLNILKKIGGGDFGTQESQYADSVLAWNLNNVQTRLSSKGFTAAYDNNEKEILNTFELKIGEGSEVKGAYLIMPKFEGIKFKQDYSQKENEGYMYIQLNGGEDIIFSTTEKVDFLNFPAFISPPISRLSIQKAPLLDTEKISKQTLIILVTLLVTFVGFIIYLALQQWYKRKYENFLFKNRNDLYNIVSYIQNMKKQGIEDSKVASGLRKSGWSSEQVDYIMKKYYGRMTGMFEIPIDKIINLFKKKLARAPPRESRKFNKGPNFII